MNLLFHEWRLLSRSWMVLAALLLLMVLSSVAVVSGLKEVSRQKQTIARLAGLQEQERAAQRDKLSQKGDAGPVAYHVFAATWDSPAPAAFLALGLRDTAPYVLRIRALALQAQLHEGEVFNPELALASRFDFAFVLVYLAPLFLIALLHDLISSERHAGRLAMLQSLPGGGGTLWWRRATLRMWLVFACLGLPVVVGSCVSGAPVAVWGMCLGVTLAYVVFWTGAVLLVAGRRRSSSVGNAMALVGCWVVLTLVLPALANAAVSRALPVPQGVELMLAQRQNVHAAWDLPREETLQKFFRTHPRWKNTAPLPEGFHWKWYYAFQQVGDESVAPPATAYREGLLARQRWSERLGWLLPGVGAQVALHRVARTDLPAQLAYQDAVAAFHLQLRGFYYPYLFNEIRFGAKDFDALPRFQPMRADDHPQPGPLLAIAFASMFAMTAGWLQLSRVWSPGRGVRRAAAGGP